MALLEAWEVVEANSSDGRYRAAAEALLTWIDTHTREEDEPGGFSGGYQGWEPNPRKLRWRSTEHNLDILAAANRTFKITANRKWRSMADHARSFLSHVFNDQDGFRHCTVHGLLG